MAGLSIFDNVFVNLSSVVPLSRPERPLSSPTRRCSPWRSQSSLSAT